MKSQEHITEVLQTILGFLDISFTEITVEKDEKTGSLRFVIHTPQSATLIGEHGARLLALNHLVKRIVEREEKDEHITFFIDVNDYQKKHIEDIRMKAQVLAERARYFKSSVEMDPMSSYERMIIHSEFTEVPDIKTESVGMGKDRRVVIVYTENKSSEISE